MPLYNVIKTYKSSIILKLFINVNVLIDRPTLRTYIVKLFAIINQSLMATMISETEHYLPKSKFIKS